ncbi:hypothetical protein KYLE_101 [Pantoea phage Kyle]|uniref:Uncharacterized protein n=1 Tax=Pantoea phage Kyle TaxID=2589665 RepID=A0A514A8R9_9CAUD|nr:hypothetical protein HWC52_gp101 [Pantoea phage Kyle]QDH49649.1 hypothetical protein KYLE_101 [Pantoea phage Kyle]
MKEFEGIPVGKQTESWSELTPEQLAKSIGEVISTVRTSTELVAEHRRKVESALELELICAVGRFYNVPKGATLAEYPFGRVQYQVGPDFRQVVDYKSGQIIAKAVCQHFWETAASIYLPWEEMKDKWSIRYVFESFDNAHSNPLVIL